MQPPEPYFNPYDKLAPVYDVMARALLAPFGGEERFRSQAIDTLDVRPGMRVLELGCGTGAMTARLLSRGAEVTAVELSTPMLKRARRRAPEARFLQRDMLTLDEGASFDRVLFSFVLHEMTEDIRARAFAVARAHLVAGTGRVGVLDFAGAAPSTVDRVFRAYLRRAEPEVAFSLLEGGLDAELRQSGLRPEKVRHLAMGTAQFIVARPDAA